MHNKLNVLFLCTANSCRSIMAEALLRHHCGDKFNVFSAGVNIGGCVHSLSLATLTRLNVKTDNLVSQAISEYLDQPIDIVISVCSAADKLCPSFNVPCIKVNWAVADPVRLVTAYLSIEDAFMQICIQLEDKIKQLIELDVSSMNQDVLRQNLEHIGASV